MEYKKLLLEEINKIRRDPKSFAEKLLEYKQYFEGNCLTLPGSNCQIDTKEGFKAYEEAANILKSTNPLPELSTSKVLRKISSELFDNIKNENLDEINFDSLKEKYGIDKLENIIENGNISAERFVINCIVCDGDRDRENRHILLSNNLLKIGIDFWETEDNEYYTIICLSKFTNEDIIINKHINNDDIHPEIISGISGIFIAFEKIYEHFLIYYNLKKISGDAHRLKYIEEKEKYIEKIKQFVEETLISNLFINDKSLLNSICKDFCLYIIFKYKILYKNITNYNYLFSLINIIFGHELNDYEEIDKKESKNIFYSIFYFFFIFEKEIYHLIDIYAYLLIKFKEENISNEDKFFELFKSSFLEKVRLYKEKQDLYSIYSFIEALFHLLNEKSVENRQIISLFKNIVPEFIRLNENLNLNGREIYTFIELIKVEEILGDYDNDIKKSLFELIINSSEYEISVHRNIDLKKQENENSENIMLLSENESEISKEEAKTLFTNLNKIFKFIIEKINKDIDIKYTLITEILTQELKKYNNDFYYFIILRNLLVENNGEAFEYSKNIFQIILNKFLFQKIPKEEEEIKSFFDKISDENNSFIKNYNFIVKNPKLKVFLEEIILQIFGFYLNGYFMKYTDQIDKAIVSYKNLSKEICKNIFEENLPFLKASIKFLEDELQNSNFDKKILSTLFCCNFIQNYFYHLVKYIYDNKDVAIDQLYDYSPIIKARSPNRQPLSDIQ